MAEPSKTPTPSEGASGALIGSTIRAEARTPTSFSAYYQFASRTAPHLTAKARYLSGSPRRRDTLFSGDYHHTMSFPTSKMGRAVLAVPFLGIAIVCFQAMDLAKMIAHQQPFLESRIIAWSDGSIPILSRFFYTEFLDEVWRGTTASFSPSTLGYDRVSSWQMFSFLNDLGPLLAVWILESGRVGNRWTPAYL